jgi:F-type H+-transporting ATPase subunit b
LLTAIFTLIFMPILPLASIIDNLQEVGTQTGFNFQQFIAQCIAFTSLSVILWIFAGKPVRTILEQRRKTIEESMANAAQIKKELADAASARLGILQKANEQAHGIISDAEKAAAVRTEQLAREATRQAEDIVKKAHEAAVLDRDRLLAELKHQVGALVVQTTAKVTGKVLTNDDQTRLNSETLQQLSATNN